MFDFRSRLIAWSGPAGLVLAALIWFAYHGASDFRPIAILEAQLSASRPVRASVGAVDPSLISRIANAPLFVLTTGPAAVAETKLELQGLAITPASKAVLLSVDGKPADWYELGATRNGITVMDIQHGKVTVDTATGFKDVELSKRPTPSSPSPTSATEVSPVALDPTPRGFRPPPAPASAPADHPHPWAR